MPKKKSGYINRLLPLPLPHRQPYIRDKANPRYTPFFVEPVWTELVPMTRTRQYILFWYVAETVPPAVEQDVTMQQKALQAELFTQSTSAAPKGDGEVQQTSLPLPYVAPPPFSQSMTLKERVAMEPEGHQPVKHAGTGVDSEELMYESHLLPVEEAMEKLKGTVSSDVVRRAWAGIQLRMKMEEAIAV